MNFNESIEATVRRDHRRLGLLGIIVIGLIFLCGACVTQSQVDRRYLGRGYAGGGRVDDSEMFYEDLAPYGRWITHEAYGRVWRPLNVSPGWRPYTEGYWQYSRDYGWVWMADQEWGWAPFHYGRWVSDRRHGWVWVPGREWAPAWVVWRYGGGYVEWAPMPPMARFQSGRVGQRYFSYERDLSRNSWVGVPDRYLHDREMSRHIIGQRDNGGFSRRATTVVTVEPVNGRVFNRGVPVDYLEKVTGRPVPRVRLNEMRSPNAGDSRRQNKGGVQESPPLLQPQKSVDIRPEQEKTGAVSTQQQEPRENIGQSGSGPRMSSGIVEENKPLEVRPEGGLNSLPVPPSEGEMTKGRGMPRQVEHPDAQPIVRKNERPTIPAGAPAIVPLEKRKERPPTPVGEDPRSLRHELKRDVPQQDVPVIQAPSGPVPPEVLNVAKPTDDGAPTIENGEVPTSQTAVPPVVPVDQSPPIIAPARNVPRSLQDNRPPDVRDEQVPDSSRDQTGGPQVIDLPPQTPVAEPVVPTLPDPPFVRPPEVPAPPQIMPPQDAEQPRPDRELDSQGRRDAQGGRDVIPEMAHPMEAQGPPAAEAVGPDDQDKRKKKSGGEQEEEENGQKEIEGQPQPLP